MAGRCDHFQNDEKHLHPDFLDEQNEKGKDQKKLKNARAPHIFCVWYLFIHWGFLSSQCLLQGPQYYTWPPKQLEIKKSKILAKSVNGQCFETVWKRGESNVKCSNGKFSPSRVPVGAVMRHFCNGWIRKRIRRTDRGGPPPRTPQYGISPSAQQSPMTT